jgi:peptide deformylase
MYHAEGCGIAAPQVGLALRLFVVDANDLADDYVEAKGFKKVFVNPEILEISGEPWLYREGCLSIPEFREDIVRKSIVKIKYFDEDFNEYTEIYGGIIARIIQHEYDHLESVLFPDLLSQLKKKMVKKKLDRIKTGKVRPHYASKFD